MTTGDAFLFMERNRGKWPLAKMAQALEVSVSGYHRWRSRGKTSRQEADRKLLEEMERINAGHRVALGVRPMTALLRKELGEPINHKRVQRVMRRHGMKGLCRRRKTKAKTTDSGHGLAVAENLLNRDFQTKGPKEKMVSDTTYVWTSRGFVYLAAMLDLHGRKVVGMAMSENNDKELVLAALKDAKERCGSLRGCLVHSDRGSTYCSRAYREKLLEHGCVCSMSRKGNCWDNAPMESFWNTLKLEALDRKIRDLEEARSLCLDYVWFYYNCGRPHSSNGYETPNRYNAKRKR